MRKGLTTKAPGSDWCGEEIWKKHVGMESMARRSVSSFSEMDDARQSFGGSESSPFKSMAGATGGFKGQVVEMLGIRRRPELNGLSARILSSDVDEHGYLTVMVLGAPRSQASPDSLLPPLVDARVPRRMKVHPCRLLLRSSSAPEVAPQTANFTLPVSSPGYRFGEWARGNHAPSCFTDAHSSIASTISGVGGAASGVSLAASKSRSSKYMPRPERVPASSVTRS